MSEPGHSAGTKRSSRTAAACHPEVEVVIEIPRWSFLKRGITDHIDFVSPFPCPFNYGSVPDYVGLEGDLLDAVVLGPRLPRGTRLKIRAFGAIGLTDRDIYDDKLICSSRPLSTVQCHAVLLFFHFYALCKGLLNISRRRKGRTVCEGWDDAGAAIARATPRGDDWCGPITPF